MSRPTMPSNSTPATDSPIISCEYCYGYKRDAAGFHHVEGKLIPCPVATPAQNASDEEIEKALDAFTIASLKRENAELRKNALTPEEAASIYDALINDDERAPTESAFVKICSLTTGNTKREP